MADTTFGSGSIITSAWLNDVNRSVYGPVAGADTLQRRVISVNRFPGIDPTGQRDSSSAFAAAVAVALERGHCTLQVDPGTYRLDAPIELAVPTTGPQARRDTPSLVGGGMNTCILKPTFVGPAVRVRGLPPANGTGTQSGTYFFWGGELSHFTIDGSDAPAMGAPFGGGATDGIELLGVWHLAVHHVRLLRLRHGVAMPSDLVYNPNPDWSAPGKGRIAHCAFERLHGWGVFNPQQQGAPSWTVEECTFIFNGEGGILCKSSDWEVKKNGFGGMGWVDEVRAGGSPDGCCLCFAGSVTANSKNVVHGNELDGSRGASVRLTGVGPTLFYENRHITRPATWAGAEAGVLYPPRGFHLAPGSAAEPVRGLRALQEIIRVEGPGTFTYAEFANVANVADVTLEAPTLSDQSGGQVSFALQTGATASNMHVRQNYRISGPSGAASQLSGRPLPTVLAKLSGTPTSAVGDQLLAFDLPEPVMAQVWPNLYSGGQFTAPANAWYEVRARVAVLAQTAGEQHELRLFVNGTLETTDVRVSTGVVRVFPEVSARVWMQAGQTLELRLLCSAARTLTGALSRLLIEQR